MAGVTVSQARKSYGDVEVLHGIDIEIADGEFVVLVGPSGCGKSTLLRMTAGLESITSGSISIGETVVNNVPPKDRDIAMVFQSYALYPHKTVADNMAFALKLRKTDPETVRRRVEETAQILGLTPYLNRYPRQLSGGQRQRVAMGRAIVRDPQVFLFDEPLSNLDAKLRVQMRKEIKELHQRLKTTTIFVTHDQVEAMTMADKIVVLNDGHVEQVGAPLDLYDDPHNLFVATFIGSPAMNLIKGRYRKEGNRFQTQQGSEQALPKGLALEDGAELVLGVRPEHAEIGEKGLTATVSVVEPTGSETLVFLRPAANESAGEEPTGNETAGEELVVVLRDRRDFKPGQKVGFQPDPNRLQLFDAKTGRKIEVA
ncbi:MAG: sn-glycerol-3-phosphate ABC transporter ATP-binding protein UgpC [Ahrensia sp.]|nr:sn-glycerol-3-phosphate ABC transporter ATP-binding protein UgpC [Ahrensia sp.]